MKNFLFSLLMITQTYSYACFPENNLHYDKREKSVGTLSEAKFNRILKSFQEKWTPFVREKKGKKFIVEGIWDSPRVNAHATRDDDNNPVIVINGGIARYEDMDEDGLSLILCHELGHHFGGAPKSLRGRSDKRSWSSAEGQADYFATSFCMSHTLESREWDLYEKPSFDNSLMNVTPCETSTCRRIFKASLVVSKMFASLKSSWRVPSFEEKATQEVMRTNYKHPEPQCRLDTYIAGFNCGIQQQMEFDDVDPFYASCANEWARPVCWFSPNKY